MSRAAWPKPMKPRPFRLVGANLAGPLVLTCEHASPRLPAGITARGAAAEILRTHWGWDIGAWALARRVALRQRASLVGGGVTRLWVDLNRPVGDPSLVVRQAGHVRLPWNARLPPTIIERRVGHYHVPYHVEVDRLVVRRLTRGVRPLLLAIHSFTPELHGRTRNFDMGVLYDVDVTHARHLVRALRREGFSVRENEPYSGLEGLMYSIHRHGAHHRLPSLELEVNQALLAVPGRIPALAAAVGRSVARVVKLSG